MSEESNKVKPTMDQVLQAMQELFRAIARPAVTIIFAAVIAEGVLGSVDFPQWFLGLAIPCITWWFAERTITHAREKKS